MKIEIKNLQYHDNLFEAEVYFDGKLNGYISTTSEKRRDVGGGYDYEAITAVEEKEMIETFLKMCD